MSLLPTVTEMIARARADLRMGLPVLLSDGQERRAAILAAEAVTRQRFEAFRALGATTLCVTAWRADTLKARAYDGDLARLIVPRDADVGWVRDTAEPANDLASPFKGPYQSEREGDASFHRAAIRLVKSARLLPAALVVEATELDAANLTELPLGALEAELAALSPLHDVVAGRVPTRRAHDGKVHVFRPEDGGDEHYAIEIGRPDRAKPVLVRLHSACFTGDVLGSLKCDCGPQLDAALAAMGAEGSGILLYLNQEGRGIGLANKMRAYALQDQGFDTVEANHRLGFEDDERDFRIGSAILKEMGVTQVSLMTNNPAKVAWLEKSGITVASRVPLKVGENPLNSHYLRTKAQKSGHFL